jgi:hypothetical protein
MDAVYTVSSARRSEAVPILSELVRNAEQFALGLEERDKIEKAVQTLSGSNSGLDPCRRAHGMS